MDTKGGKAWWGGTGGVMNWAIGIDMYTLMCIKLMTNKNLQYKKTEQKNPHMSQGTTFLEHVHCTELAKHKCKNKMIKNFQMAWIYHPPRRQKSQGADLGSEFRVRRKGLIAPPAASQWSPRF